MSAVATPVGLGADPFSRALACAERLPQADLYSAAGAPVYEAVASTDATEVALIARLARGVRGPIVDLACGGGRLTLALAARGAEVLAVDDAPAMLALLDERLADVPAGLAARVHPRQDDATTTALPQDAELVVLGATSIALFDPEARGRLLHAVAVALTPTGRFLVSVHDAVPTHDGDHVDLIAMPERGLLATFAERISATAGQREVLVLPVLVDGHPVQPIALRSTIGILDATTLIREAEEAGLRVLDRHHLATDAAAGDAVVLELGRAAA